MFDFIFKLKLNMTSLKVLISYLSAEASGKKIQINQTIDSLNNLKKEIKRVNEEWEEIKKDILVFQNYEGQTKNKICQNFQNSDENECLTLSKE
ncbi:hypothetical protein [Mycoplasma suis]|uniref:hypothetical protein n=1 Tax=Mycoplasma suis TaxID=57372 RepID=UPI0011D0A1B9|nr:hypothetical protein [Mycoplasma suis]